MEPNPTIEAARVSEVFAWSLETFGPGDRTNGVLDHIEKELVEVAADPDDPFEWADLIILAFDGACRRGIPPHVIVEAVNAKWTKNMTRSWPDWRTMDPNKAIEHVRGDDE